jgi:hypothetical protein
MTLRQSPQTILKNAHTNFCKQSLDMLKMCALPQTEDDIAASQFNEASLPNA